MTQRDHLEVSKWGVKGPPILFSKNGLPWDFSENLWSKIWGALNPPFSHLQMIPLGHMNIPTGLFLENNFISIHPIWLTVSYQSHLIFNHLFDPHSWTQMSWGIVRTKCESCPGLPLLTIRLKVWLENSRLKIQYNSNVVTSHFQVD